MEQVPRCPRCGVEVQPHWDRCEECGYSHHDDPELDTVASPAPPPPPPPPPPPAPGFFDAPAPSAMSGATSAAAAGSALGDGPADGLGDEPVSFDLPATDEVPADAPPPPPPPPPVEPERPAAVDPPPPPDEPDAPAAFDPYPFRADPVAAPADPLSRWEAQASPAPGSAPAAEAAADGGDGDDGTRRGKRITAADGARARSSFQPNKLLVGAVVVVAALVLVWQGANLLKSEEPKAAAPAGTTIPPLGAIATTTTPQTTPDGVTIVPPPTTTTTINSQPQCDSSTSVFSADGKGYRPCGGGFQVDLPGRADVRTSTSDTAVGPVRWTSLTSTDNTQDPWVRSVVVYGDLGRELAPEEVTSMQEALVAQLFAKPGQATTFLDQPALTFTGTDANGDDIVGIAFVSGTRAYALATKSPGSPQAGFDALRDSFAFL